MPYAIYIAAHNTMSCTFTYLLLVVCTGSGIVASHGRVVIT